jgi:hypothetical protein
MTQSTPVGPDLSPEATLDRRLHDAGWALLLVLTGLMWLVPSNRVPEGAWLIGVAAILLTINVVRAARHIRISGFSLVLGLLALAAGVGRSMGVNLPLLAICLLVIGASLVVRPWMGAPQH